MADDLPTDPQEREIFLRALRDYSERCEHPKLTADCPFSIDISPDLRGCGEECMDLLARHGAPGPTEEFPLGDGLTAIRVRRPRPRRNAQKHPKAYDSREVYLHDQSTKPPSRWRLAAILRGIIEESCEPPPADNDQAAERKDQIYELIRCAELRGLDPDEHFLPHVRLAVAGSAFAQLLGSLHGRDEPESFDHTGGWAAVAEQFGTDDSDSGPYRSDGAWLGDLYGAIIKWSLACSLEELLDWMPPAPERFSRPLALPDPHSDDDGTWIVERFTRTFLWEWSVPSLRREWLYLHGQHPAPCSAEDMEVRAVSENELALLMADRLAAEPPPYSQLSARLVGSAAGFITEGRRREAVALFEATLHLEPDSQIALNNLGFCLLPDEPKAALDVLERAVASGRGDVDLANLNRVLALASLGRYTSALGLVESMLDEWGPQRLAPPTYLWDIDPILHDGDPVLATYQDFREYAETLWAAIKVRLSHMDRDAPS